MLKERTQLNRYKLDKAIKNYNNNLRRYMRMKDKLDSLIATATTAKYGIDATMPISIGKTSDPVYAHVQIRASRVVRMDKIKDELLMVQNLSRKVTGEIEQEILFWLLEGMPFRWIGARLNMSHTSVQRVRERILDIMIK